MLIIYRHSTILSVITHSFEGELYMFMEVAGNVIFSAYCLVILPYDMETLHTTQS